MRYRKREAQERKTYSQVLLPKFFMQQDEFFTECLRKKTHFLPKNLLNLKKILQDYHTSTQKIVLLFYFLSYLFQVECDGMANYRKQKNPVNEKLITSAIYKKST